jgi:SAM-dependent methyltransferase
VAERGFFDDYPRFAETSKTGPSLNRINARHRVIIDGHREFFNGARVLDLASHDGRFTLAAIRAGAREVVGIEHDPELIERANDNFRELGVEPETYQFLCRDLFEGFDDLGRFDVVLCFGILYHVNDHLTLLSNIAAVEPSVVLIDTHVSAHEGAVIELRSPLGVSPPRPGSGIEGHPSRGALEALTSTLGWTGTYVDWAAAAKPDDEGIDDYLSGKRVTMVASCPPPIDEGVRNNAVTLVFQNQQDPQWQWLAITSVSEQFGINAQALRMWVRRAERKGRGPRSPAGGGGGRPDET